MGESKIPGIIYFGVCVLVDLAILASLIWWTIDTYVNTHDSAHKILAPAVLGFAIFFMLFVTPLVGYISFCHKDGDPLP